MARMARPGSGRDWTIVQTVGRQDVVAVAGAHVGEGALIDHGIMGEIAATARDDPEVAAKSGATEENGDAVEIGSAAGGKDDRACAGEEVLAMAGCRSLGEKAEESVDRLGGLENPLEAFDAAERQSVRAD